MSDLFRNDVSQAEAEGYTFGHSVGAGTVAHLIHYWAERTPDAVAIAAPGRPSLTYAHLWVQLQSIVQSLGAAGIDRNDRVAIVLPNGPEAAVSFLSVSSWCTAAPLNPAYGVDELVFYLSDLRAKAVMVLSGMGSRASAAAAQLKAGVLELSTTRDGFAGAFDIAGSAGSAAGVDKLGCSDDIALLLHTSGTTSRPKIVPLTHANLCISAHNISRALRLSQNDRSLCVMPLFHVHGLVGSLISSIAAGAATYCASGFQAPRFFDWMEECRPTWYSAVPTMHQAILSRAVSLQVTIPHELRFIRSSSAPLQPRLAEELERFFGVPVVEAYSMTEASHQIALNPLPPGERKLGSVGLPAGPLVAIVDRDGTILSSGQTGEIAIRGDSVIRGYENNQEANREAFVDGWFRTGDLGYLDSDGYLFITGRLKEIINRGGEKISPREIDAVLEDHPAVAQAVAFPCQHPVLGEEVVAAVVLREDASATEREIREFAASRLADFKVPRRIAIVDGIPIGPTGKLQRVGLAKKLGITVDDVVLDQEEIPFVEPATSLQRALASIWAEVLGIRQVGIHDGFLGLGGDSVLATLIIARVREALQVEVSFLDFFEASTIAGLAAVIDDNCSEGQNASAG